MKKTILQTAKSSLPTKYGNFRILIYKSKDSREHVCLLKGKVKKTPMLTRIHSKCLTSDTLLSLKCDCRQQLHKSMKMIQKEGSGIIIYLDQEGRGIGLTGKIKAYGLQDKGLDTVEANHSLGFKADARDYEAAAEILHDLGISQILLLTNNPDKVAGLEKYGITVLKRVPIQTKVTKKNKSYLIAKKVKLGHILSIHE